VTTESNECDATPGITWAAWRRLGDLVSQECRCELTTPCQFGRQAMRGTAARTMFLAGALVLKKWLVAPESRMAHHFMVAALTLNVLRMMEAARA
jgi:hypothetical protein